MTIYEQFDAKKEDEIIQVGPINRSIYPCENFRVWDRKRTGQIIIISEYLDVETIITERMELTKATAFKLCAYLAAAITDSEHDLANLMLMVEEIREQYRS